ncbi:MAG: ABC transporter permease [Acidimicrobiales bacterium]
MRYLKGLLRAGEVILTLWLVTLASFFITSRLPSNEAETICGTAPAGCVTAEEKVLYLNHAFFARYFHWLFDVLGGNLGLAAAPRQPIGQMLSQAYGTTLELMIYSQIIAFAIAIPLAMWSALRANGWFDRISTAFSFGTLSLPAFILGPLLVLVFTLKLAWFPGPRPEPSLLSQPFTNLHIMFLPSFTLAIGSLAVYQRLLRADMISTLEEDFILMARAKGLSTGRILLRHALRPSTFTLLTVGGVQIASLIQGAVLVEVIFDLNGLGSHLVFAATQDDLPTVQILVVIIALAFIALNALVDQLYEVIDPRVRRARVV